MKTIITSYGHADLDGTACAYAYAELLRAQAGSDKQPDIVCAISGSPHREAEFVLANCAATIADFDSEFTPDANIIVVDASDVFGLDKKIDLHKIIEVIDHRRSNDVARFVNARVQVEFVGAAATLIYERFVKADYVPSRESALLLYCAILSNTINFKANVTTDRDRNAAAALLSLARLPDNFIHQMFKAKSTIDNITFAMEKEFSLATKGSFLFSIVQLELIDARNFVTTNREVISAVLAKMKVEKHAKAIFLTCVDVELGYNIIFCDEVATQELLSKTFGWSFSNSIAQTQSVIMRKEIIPLLKEKIV